MNNSEPATPRITEKSIILEFIQTHAGWSLTEIALAVSIDVCVVKHILRNAEREGLVHCSAKRDDLDGITVYAKTYYPSSGAKGNDQDKKGNFNIEQGSMNYHTLKGMVSK